MLHALISCGIRQRKLSKKLLPNLVGVENDGRGGDNLLERAELLVKALAVCCHQKNALAVLSNYALHEIQTYLNLASLLKQGTFPIMNLVSFHFITD